MWVRILYTLYSDTRRYPHILLLLDTYGKQLWVDRDYEQTTEVEDVYDDYDNRFIVTFRYLFIYCKPHTYLQGPHNSSQKLVPTLSATPKDLLTQWHYLHSRHAQVSSAYCACAELHIYHLVPSVFTCSGYRKARSSTGRRDRLVVGDIRHLTGCWWWELGTYY